MIFHDLCAVVPAKMDLDSLDPQELEAYIRTELTEKEITEINIRILGNIIHRQAFFLSKKVNDELLKPISKWLNDPDWMKRFRVYEDHSPNWAEYKSRQRQWTREQKLLIAERMKHYWQEITRKRKLRKEMSQILGRPSRRTKPILPLTDDFLTAIIAPFSIPQQRKAETKRQFQQASSQSISNLLPWRLLITSELSQTRRFTDLTIIYTDNLIFVNRVILS